MDHRLAIHHSNMVTAMYSSIGAVLALSALLDHSAITADVRADYELMLVRARDAIEKYEEFCTKFNLTPVTVPTI